LGFERSVSRNKKSVPSEIVFGASCEFHRISSSRVALINHSASR
jgi:hypothetical protein